MSDAENPCDPHWDDEFRSTYYPKEVEAFDRLLERRLGLKGRDTQFAQFVLDRYKHSGSGWQRRLVEQYMPVSDDEDNCEKVSSLLCGFYYLGACGESRKEAQGLFIYYIDPEKLTMLLYLARITFYPTIDNTAFKAVFTLSFGAERATWLNNKALSVRTADTGKRVSKFIAVFLEANFFTVIEKRLNEYGVENGLASLANALASRSSTLQAEAALIGLWNVALGYDSIEFEVRYVATGKTLRAQRIAQIFFRLFARGDLLETVKERDKTPAEIIAAVSR